MIIAVGGTKIEIFKMNQGDLSPSRKGGYVLGLSMLLAAVVLPGAMVEAAPGTGTEAHQERSSPVANESPNAEFEYPTFADNSFWYQAIPESVVLNNNSQKLALEFARQVKTYYGQVALNTWDYSSPLYTVDLSVQTTKVSLWDCLRSGFSDSKLAQDFAAVPIPSYAEPAGGSDSEMSIYQPGTDTLWEFWRARKVAGAWQACWGGRMSDVSKTPGVWEKPFGASATGLPFEPGQIQVEELRRGEIRHVMGIALVEAEARTYSWPANRSDGSNPNKVPDRILEGARLRLDPSVNIDALHLTPIAKTIARAAQIYGFVVWDLAGSVSLRAENPKRYTAVGVPNPYQSLLGNTPMYDVMKGFPWDKMQFLPVDYGKPN